MPEPLKNMFNRDSVRALALAIQAVYGSFQVEAFLAQTVDQTWEDLELKARGRRVTTYLGKFLPADYASAIGVINQVVDTYSGPGLYCFPDFVEVFGQDLADWDVSIAALERYTAYASAELAVRPFIIHHQDRMMAQMYQWSQHLNAHVRRLASEGCRPQLPWAPALTSFKADPAPVLPILEQLKTDPSEDVRRSVANNLNDISKTHPELVVKLAQAWHGQHERTDWIIKHGCRTLLKQGRQEVLAIFGYHDTASVQVSSFTVAPATVPLGLDLGFSFSVLAKATTKLRLEYGIDFVKANGQRRRKIFQISESSLRAGQHRTYTKTHSLADLSTRKHYPGTHSLALIINGVERGCLDFELTLP